MLEHSQLFPGKGCGWLFVCVPRFASKIDQWLDQKVGAIHELSLSSSNTTQTYTEINLSIPISQYHSNYLHFSLLERPRFPASQNWLMKKMKIHLTSSNNHDFPQNFHEMNPALASLRWRKLQSLFRWRKLWTQLDTSQERAAAARKIQAVQRGRQVRRGAERGISWGWGCAKFVSYNMY